MPSNVAPTEDLKAASLFNVEGLVAVVTGGGTGIGLMIAQGFAANGAKVYITGRREEVLETSAKEHGSDTSGSIIPIPADISTKDGIKALVKEISDKEDGTIHLLVNNAGISGPKQAPEGKNASEYKEELWKPEFDEWSNTFQTNVSSIYFVSVAFLPLLEKGLKSKKGYAPSIINISSISGLTKLSQDHFCYNSSKAAAIHLTRMMATEFQNLKIRCNTIAPGVFPSEMTADESDEKNKSTKDDKMDIAAGRAGDIKEMVGTALYLASRAGLYTNGVVIPVDGGFLLSGPSSY